ncbi:MAG: 4'-phosphopantetheinyl transferase superfamily protein [Candidatus Moraniibacteriota bacterium]
MVHVSNQILTGETAHEYLSSGEYVAYEELAPKKRADWLVGRMAAKQAIVDEIYRRTGRTVSWQDVEIVSGKKEKPTFRLLASSETLIPEEYSLTLSHTAGQAVAALSFIRESGFVGVDIERERICSNDFSKAFLTEREFQSYIETGLLSPLSLWCYKEAFLKALGTGLRAHPRMIEMTLDDQGELVRIEKDGLEVSFRAEKLAFPGVPFGAIVYLT